MSHAKKVELIARVVMGYSRSNELGCWFRDGQIIANPDWNPFASWADAGMVLDALKAKGITFSVFSHTDVTDCYLALESSEWDGTGSTGPEAISEAAAVWAAEAVAEFGGDE